MAFFVCTWILLFLFRFLTTVKHTPSTWSPAPPCPMLSTASFQSATKKISSHSSCPSDSSRFVQNKSYVCTQTHSRTEDVMGVRPDVDWSLNGSPVLLYLKRLFSSIWKKRDGFLISRMVLISAQHGHFTIIALFNISDKKHDNNLIAQDARCFLDRIQGFHTDKLHL